MRLSRSDRQARLTVHDQGVGIPRAALPRIFGRFHGTSDVNLHTVTRMGISLYIVKQVVELHGGAVDVQSVEGQDSTFSVTLPLHPPAKPAVALP